MAVTPAVGTAGCIARRHDLAMPLSPMRSFGANTKNNAKPLALVQSSASATSDSLEAAIPTSRSSPNDVVVKTEKGGNIVIPGRTIAGLSTEFRVELLERAKLGRELPVIYENPGSHSQMDRVPDAVIMALPPPRRPLWPVEEHTRTWHLVRAFSFGIIFVALAGYLHLKSTVQGSARLELERSAPWLAQALVKMGIIPDLAAMDDSMDRKLLFARIFRRYTPSLAASESVRHMPAPRAMTLLGALLGEGAAGEAAALQAAAQAGVATTGSVTSSDFVSLFERGCKGLSNALLRLGAEELYGMSPAPQEILTALGECYDRVVAARGARNAFTPLALSELSQEIGFSTDVTAAASFLSDCEAATVGGLQVQLPGPSGPADNGAITSPPVAIPMRRDEFIDFLSMASSSSGVSHVRLQEYLRVFYMLHLSGIREAAGVKTV